MEGNEEDNDPINDSSSDAPHKERWNSCYAELKQYKEANRTCDVPLSDKKLGQWVAVQRKNYRLLQDGKPSFLTAQRLMKLTELGLPMTGKRGPKTKIGSLPKRTKESTVSWDEVR